MTYQAIADATGVSYQTAYKAAADVQLIDFNKLPGKDGKLYPPAYAPRRESEEQPEPSPAPANGKARRTAQDGRNVEFNTPTLENRS